MDAKSYPGHKAMDWSEIWRGELLGYADIVGNICTEWAKPPPLTVEEVEVVNNGEHTVCECARWQNYRSFDIVPNPI